MSKFAERIRAAKFEDSASAETILRGLQPVIGLTTESGKPTQGQSKIGGNPHLPKGFAWPTGRAFLAQINLAESHPHDADRILPAEGMLYLFVSTDESELSDPEDASCMFFHAGHPGALNETKPPKEVDEVEGRLQERLLRFGPSYRVVEEAQGGFERARFDYEDEQRFDELLRAEGCVVPDAGQMLGSPLFFRFGVSPLVRCEEACAPRRPQG